jgi:hypothetical protein
MGLALGAVALPFASAAAAIGASTAHPRLSAARDAGHLRLKRSLSLPSPAFSRPAGVAYSASIGLYHVIGAGGATSDPPAILTLTAWGERVGLVTIAGAHGACTIAYDDHHGRLLLADRAGVLWAIPAGPRGELDPTHASRLSITRAGVLAAVALAVDSEHGEILSLDSAAQCLMRWTQGSAEPKTIDLTPLGISELGGLAVDSGSGRLFVTDSRSRRLFVLSREGAPIARHELGALGITRPGALVLAPSTDGTDDPTVENLFIVDSGNATVEGRFLELAATAPITVSAPTTLAATLVRTVLTSGFSPPSPDPSGIAYDAAIGRLVLSDGEVDEMSIWAGKNVFETSLSGVLQRGYSVGSFTYEPTGVAFDPVRRWRYITDDDQRRVFVVRPGSDGTSGTADDVITSFSTTAFGSGDPEGVSYDAAGNRLFIADGVNEEIYVLTAGANGVFDGVAPGGDDQMTHFDTTVLGVLDPETVEYRPEAGTLFLLGRTNHVVLEVTTSGAPVSQTDLSFVPLANPAGLAYAPSSSDPNAKSWYIVNRAVDNDDVPSENDGVMFEVALRAAPPPGNGVDVRVAASADDAEESASGGVSLTSSDLEFVYDGSNQKVGMRFAGVQVPRGATITSAYVQLGVDEAQTEATALAIQGQAADNAATFVSTSGNVSSRPRTAASVPWSPAGWIVVGAMGPDQRTPDLSAVLQEIVDRPGWSSGNALAIIMTGSGHRTAYAYDGTPSGAPLIHVAFQDSASNRVPIVSAGLDQTLALPANVALDGTVSDDGLPNPPGALTTTWTLESGPAAVTFANANAVDTQASFASSGTYVLRLSADDGALAASDLVTVTVLPLSDNHAPVVNAGPDQTITLPASAALDGTVADDGLPIPPGALTVGWSVESGPGAVTFASPNAVDTQASFAAGGTYVLRLTASDGALSASDRVTITVQTAITTFERRISAGADDVEESATGTMSLASADLQLVDDATSQVVGLRFRNLAIPRNATILKAYVQFRASRGDTGATSLVIQAQASNDAPKFTTTTGDLSTRPRTSAAVAWAPPAWIAAGDATVAQRTTDLSLVIQEVVSGSSWVSGKALAVVITGSGRRTAQTYEAHHPNAAILHVEYRP